MIGQYKCQKFERLFIVMTAQQGGIQKVARLWEVFEITHISVGEELKQMYII